MPVIPPGFSTTTKKSTRTASSEAYLTVGLEFLAVALFTLMAGAGPDMGSLMTLLMVGFWMIFLITNPSLITGLEKKLGVA